MISHVIEVIVLVMDLPPQDESRLTALSQSPEERVVSGPRPFRAITHLAVVTTFILSVTVLPYVLTRRRLSSLHRQVDSMGATMRILQQDLSQARSEAVTHKEDTRRMKALLHQMMQEADRLRLRADKREAEQAGSDGAIRSDLRMLLNERQHARSVYIYHQ
jgi:outer membrane murein-binding lipoprotein Lpp